MNNATRPMHASRVAARAVPQLGRLQRQLGERAIAPPPTRIPRTRWSGPVSAHRVFDAVRLRLDDLRAIKATVPGATINDVVLTTVGGALRTYLLAKDELPDDPLIAMAPISVRSETDKAAAGNMVSGMLTTLGTDVADPYERLVAVREGTHESKEFANALGARTLLDMADLMPGGLVGLGARTSARLSLANRMRPMFNTTVTNMPGPQHPLYMAGAQLVAMYVVGMIIEGMGLIHPVTSYCGDITISFTSCREMLPDPGVLCGLHPRVVRRPVHRDIQSIDAAATNVTALRGPIPPDPVEGKGNHMSGMSRRDLLRASAGAAAVAVPMSALAGWRFRRRVERPGGWRRRHRSRARELGRRRPARPQRSRHVLRP